MLLSFVACFLNMFATHLQAHLRNIWRLENDPLRCDYVAPHVDPESPCDESAGDTAGDTDDSTQDDSTQYSEAAEEESDDSASGGVPLITTPIVPTPLDQLSRREPFSAARTLALRSAYCINAVDVDVSGARDYIAIQDKWDDMLRSCAQRFSPVFWQFFLKVHTFSQVAIDTALRSVRKMPFFPLELRTKFPSSKRNLMRNLDCINKFWSIVRHNSRIDLSHFELPSGTKWVDFTFIDPIWGWLLAARKHHPADLHWKPHAQHRTNAPVYGGGIQFGECFKHAYMNRPDGSHLMLISFHWDGTYGRSLDVTPIAVGVANINNNDKSKETCIGYMPFTPDQKLPEFKKSAKCTR